MEEQIRSNAELVMKELRTLSGIDFDYNYESVEWLQGYIERLRNSGEFDSDDQRKRLISVFGSFLGECIVRCYGGTWVQREGVWCVALSKGDDRNLAFPFAKVAKQFDNGVVDGISGFFRVIPIIFDGRLGSQVYESHGPWWKFWRK